MPAQEAYQWTYVAPGSTVSVYLHGFPATWAVVFSATPFSLELSPVGSIDLTQGKVDIHVDGTIARTAWVQNLDPAHPVDVILYVIYENVPFPYEYGH
ncbi:MAG: hypothetical protein OK455_05990 [Thaumarchaeota archaeon]|nr:hypothetical protein [Nitrososphaerota archaeon]